MKIDIKKYRTKQYADNASTWVVIDSTQSAFETPIEIEVRHFPYEPDEKWMIVTEGLSVWGHGKTLYETLENFFEDVKLLRKDLLKGKLGKDMKRQKELLLK